LNLQQLNLLLKLFVVGAGLMLLGFAMANIGVVGLTLCASVVLHYVPWILAVAPGILISYYIYWRDRHQSEPHTRLIFAFVVGALSTYPAIKMEEYGIYVLEIVPSEDLWQTFLFSFFVIGLAEEGAKLWFLRAFIVPQKDFNEPLDGIVYSVMISMGFATLENIIYIIYRDGGATVGLMRMFTAVPAHAGFAIIMGYFVGLSRFAATQKRAVWYLAWALILPMTVHGLYDFFIFQKVSHYLVLITFSTLIISLLMGRKLIDRHETHSISTMNNNQN
jgi:RsiW-degrading membrane proteinase PrsW (M82 family)